MPYRTDENMDEIMAGGSEVCCDDCRTFPCECPVGDFYLPADATGGEVEAAKEEYAAIMAEQEAAERRVLREALPSVPDIRAKLRQAWGTEHEVFGRSLESTPKGKRSLNDSHEGNEGAA